MAPFQAKDLFSKQSAAYSVFRPTYPPGLFDDLSGLCLKREIAWDVACGTGQATTSLADLFDHVIGTDLSAEQLKYAIAKENIRYHCLSAEEDPAAISGTLGVSKVDLITVAQALHWFNIPVFLRNAAQMLKPDGVLAVWTYAFPEFPGDLELSRFVLKIGLDVLGPYWAPERELVNTRYRTIRFDGFEPILEKLEEPWGFIDKPWSKADLLGYFHSWSAYQTSVAALGRDILADFANELGQLWGEAPHRTVRFPLYVWAGRPLC